MITARSQFVFLDSAKVKRSVDRETRRVLAQGGDFLRKTAKNSIRKRKRVSKAGSPPSSHTGDLRKVFFGLEPSGRSVVVGPLKFKRGNIPEVLEKGGISTAYRRDKRTGRIVKVQIRVAARPYMNPALKIIAPRIPGLYKDKVK